MKLFGNKSKQATAAQKRQELGTNANGKDIRQSKVAGERAYHALYIHINANDAAGMKYLCDNFTFRDEWVEEIVLLCIVNESESVLNEYMDMLQSRYNISSKDIDYYYSSSCSLLHDVPYQIHTRFDGEGKIVSKLLLNHFTFLAMGYLAKDQRVVLTGGMTKIPDRPVTFFWNEVDDLASIRQYKEDLIERLKNVSATAAMDWGPDPMKNDQRQIRYLNDRIYFNEQTPINEAAVAALVAIHITFINGLHGGWEENHRGHGFLDIEEGYTPLFNLYNSECYWCRMIDGYDMTPEKDDLIVPLAYEERLLEMRQDSISCILTSADKKATEVRIHPYKKDHSIYQLISRDDIRNYVQRSLNNKQIGVSMASDQENWDDTICDADSEVPIAHLIIRNIRIDDRSISDIEVSVRSPYSKGWYLVQLDGNPDSGDYTN